MTEGKNRYFLDKLIKEEKQSHPSGSCRDGKRRRTKWCSERQGWSCCTKSHWVWVTKRCLQMMVFCQAAHLQPLNQHCLFPVVELVRIHFRDGYLHGLRRVILACTKDCAQLYCSRVNLWKTPGRLWSRRSCGFLPACRGTFWIYIHGDKQAKSLISGELISQDLLTALCLSHCPFGNHLGFLDGEGSVCFMSVVGGEFPAPLSHLIYPQNIQDNNLCSHWPFLILRLPGLALRHRALNHKPREEQIWPNAACAFVPSAFLEAEPRHTPSLFKGTLLVRQFCSTLGASRTESPELKSASLYETMAF